MKGSRILKRGRAVGTDKTSAELLLGIVQVPGGESHLLEWYNRILATQQIPKQWNEPVLIMLPKLSVPRIAKDLRPIDMGSSVCRLFCRISAEPFPTSVQQWACFGGLGVISKARRRASDTGRLSPRVSSHASLRLCWQNR